MSFLAISGIAGYEQHMVSDEALMLDFQGGSREAFEELFALTRTTAIPLRGTYPDSPTITAKRRPGKLDAYGLSTCRTLLLQCSQIGEQVYQLPLGHLVHQIFRHHGELAAAAGFDIRRLQADLVAAFVADHNPLRRVFG